MNVQSITLDLSKRQIPTQIVRIGQGDNDGTTIQAKILDNGTVTSLSGFSASFEMRLPDGESYVRDVNCTVSGSTVTYVVDEEHCCAVDGYTDEAYFNLTKNGAKYSTSRFRVKVERSAHDGATPAEDWDNAVEQLVRRGEQAVSDAEDAISDAQGAVANANTAVSNANAAATGANNAATNANNKAALANTAATNANTKAGEANTAAGKANTAASNANSAASNANAAASNANDKANLAQQVLDDGIPLMTPSVRGGAKLEEHGGLALRDQALGIGSLVQQSDGYARGGLAEVTAKGHAEQVATTGKNLLNLHALAEHKKYRCTVAENTDGSVSITASETEEFWIGDTYTSAGTQYSGSDAALVPVVAGQTYTIKAYSTEASRCLVTWLDSSKKSLFFADVIGSKSFPTTVSIVPPANSAYALFRIGRNSGDGITQGAKYLSKFQLELGSTATAYEPYTGGAPSPSPDYAQEIHVVRGRNLLRNTATSQTVNGVTFTVNADGSVTANGTAAATINYTLCTSITLPAGTYTISGAPLTTNNSLYNVRCEDVAAPNTQRMRNDGTTTLTNVPTGTIPANTPQTLLIRIYGGVTLSNVTFYPQLERGSVAHPYVPYGHVGMEVQGKNLINESSLAETTSNGVVFTPIYKSNGLLDYINVNGKATSRAQMYISNMRLPAGTYTVSMNTGVNVTAFVAILKPSGTVYVDLASVPNRVKTFTIEADYICTFTLDIVGGNVGVQINNAHVYPQLELGAEATPYEPPFHSTTPIPLPSRGWVGSLPDGTADTLRLDGAGKCEWELPTGEVVLDGSETWYIAPNGIDAFSPVINQTVLRPSDSHTSSPSLSSHYPFASINTVQRHAVIALSIDNANGNIVIAPTGQTITAAEYKAFLAQNPVTVLYPLATPVTEDCGYVDMPAIPSDAQISIPELDALGIRYFVDDTVTEYGREIIARGQHDLSETSGEIDTLEASIAPVESVVATSNHAVGDYFMLGNVLMRTTTAIATGERITVSNATPATMQSQIDALRDSVACRGDGAMNLNDVKTPGLYYAYNSATNTPVSGVGGMLIVTNGGSGVMVHQLFINNSNLMRLRTCDHGVWSVWRTLNVS